ncbi:MAG: hypothetical protein GY757_48395 [bacterium]|nr:hypothetical protein [bacterium]
MSYLSYRKETLAGPKSENIIGGKPGDRVVLPENSQYKYTPGIKDELHWRNGVVFKNKGFDAEAVVKCDEMAK